MTATVAITVDVEHPDTPAQRAWPHVSELLWIAYDEKVPLTLFVEGRWARANADQLNNKLAAHELFRWASHGYSHAPWPNLTRAGLRADMRGGDETLYGVAGAGCVLQPKFVRAPYGRVGRREWRIANRLGYVIVGWDIDFGDWHANDGPDDTPKLATPRDLGGIVLLHHWTAAAPTLLRAVIDSARREGAELVHLTRSALTRRVPSGMTFNAVPSRESRETTIRLEQP